MAYKTFPYTKTKIQETDGHVGIVFDGRGWLPEWFSAEVVCLLDEVNGEQYMYLQQRIIRTDHYMQRHLVVRNNYTRPIWRTLFRVKDTADLWKSATIRTLAIWGLAQREPGAICQWRNIRPIGWAGKRMGLWK